MATLPFEWNVVIMGSWNEAILTPDGIRKRLFQLPDGTPVDVQVAVDRPVPHRVHYDGLIVTPSSSALIISVHQCDSQSLQKACALAKNALLSLPETPLTAAGINIRYQIEELPDELLQLIETPIDGTFSDSGYVIKKRRTHRSLEFQPGEINIELSQEQTTAGEVLLNFHLDSQELVRVQEWLSRSEEFSAKALELLSIIKIPAPEGEQAHV